MAPKSIKTAGPVKKPVVAKKNAVPLRVAAKKIAKKVAKKEIKKSAASTKKVTTTAVAASTKPKIIAKSSATVGKKSATPVKKSASPSAKKSATPSSKKSATPSGKKSATPASRKSNPAFAVSNAEIIAVFRSLADYELKAGEKPFVPKAYRDVVIALQAFVAGGNNITSGKVVQGLKSCGPTTVAKIDEFLKTGKVTRLEELKKRFGNISGSAKSSGNKSAGSNKSGGGAASSSSSSFSGAKGQTLTAAQRAQVSAEETKLSGMSVDALKNLARLNGQRVTGTKGELVSLLGSQAVLGAILKCSQCGGGRPRYNEYSGLLKCPGYRDDEEFVNCTAVFDNADGSARQAFKWS